MTTVFSAGRQFVKVRSLMWASALALVVCAWQGYGLYRTYGTREADGGRLAPVGVRLAWGLGVAALGAGFFLGMQLYGARYVAGIRVDDAAGRVEIDTARLVGLRTIRVPASAVHMGRYHAGEYHSVKLTVNAPWTSLRIDGRRHRFILDGQGTVTDARAFEAMLASRTAKPSA